MFWYIENYCFQLVSIAVAYTQTKRQNKHEQQQQTAINKYWKPTEPTTKTHQHIDEVMLHNQYTAMIIQRQHQQHKHHAPNYSYKAK